jgi:hypothetical protein
MLEVVGVSLQEIEAQAPMRHGLERVGGFARLMYQEKFEFEFGTGLEWGPVSILESAEQLPGLQIVCPAVRALKQAVDSRWSV